MRDLRHAVRFLWLNKAIEPTSLGLFVKAEDFSGLRNSPSYVRAGP